MWLQSYESVAAAVVVADQTLARHAVAGANRRSQHPLTKDDGRHTEEVDGGYELDDTRGDIDSLSGILT